MLAAASLAAQTGQNPSPMVEHTRPHPRLQPAEPPGRRVPLELGTLYIPVRLRQRHELPLILHFHGGRWLAEVAAARYGRAAVISFELGSGSATYGKPFTDPRLLPRLLRQAETQSGVKFVRLTLSGWSAGYGAIREILREREWYGRVERVLLIDGLHTGYVTGKPGPLESQLEAEGLDPFLRFARDAAAGRKQMIVTHSEIFPGTYASTTETADYLLAQLGLRRSPVLRTGPMGAQQLSEVHSRGLRVVGYAGNSAPDHVDQLHSLDRFWRWFR
jgi:hypothetical protein